MKQSFLQWGERYLYRPKLLDKLLSFVLLPISVLYCLIAYIRYKLSKEVDFNIPVISIGNLTVGGNGKTPVVISMAKHFKNPAIILRGYGRATTGMIVVKDKNSILCDVYESGDEAMLYATMLKDAVVIVSEDRAIAINEAKKYGCDVVLLDDGYGKHYIKKLDFLIISNNINKFCLPSGPYRELLWYGKKAIELVEDIDFTRSVSVKNPTQKMVLVTAIAKPQRLDVYLPDVCEKFYFSDHHYFSYDELVEILDTTRAESLLVTTKDFVKIAHFNLPVSVLELELTLDDRVIDIAQRYVYEKDD